VVWLEPDGFGSVHLLPDPFDVAGAHRRRDKLLGGEDLVQAVADVGVDDLEQVRVDLC
jgi:hypothetical protein